MAAIISYNLPLTKLNYRQDLIAQDKNRQLQYVRAINL